ncbi:MAG: hypothetical protein AAB944_00205 [Patescibacteria group bacterium]
MLRNGSIHPRPLGGYIRLTMPPSGGVSWYRKNALLEAVAGVTLGQLFSNGVEDKKRIW